MPHDIRPFALQAAPQTFRSERIAHPFFQKRFGGVPQIQIRIQHAPHALDIEQRFLQHHQLRLYRNIELARYIKQTHQHLSERNFRNRPAKIRLAHRAHGGGQLVQRCIRRNPARLNVCIGHATIIAVEKSQEIDRQIVSIDFGQGADNAAIKRNIVTTLRALGANEYIPRMHIRMKKSVAKHLCEENLHAVTRQTFQVHIHLGQRIQVRHWHAIHPLHHHHAPRGVIPADFRHGDQIAALHIVAQLAGVGRLALQIQFLMQMALYLRNHLNRFEPFAINVIFFKVACRCIHTLDIDFD